MAQINITELMGNSGPNYSEIIVTPYREELTKAGFTQLLTPAQVDQALQTQDSQLVLVVLNSVCGCSARVGRPGTILSLLNHIVPDRLVTIFAGMEKDATAQLREKYLSGKTPSSPNIALFKDGKLVHILHRHQIERMAAGDIADELTGVYNSHGRKEQSSEERERLRALFIEKYQVDPLELPTT